jgi:L-asparaginase
MAAPILRPEALDRASTRRKKANITGAVHHGMTHCPFACCRQRCGLDPASSVARGELATMAKRRETGSPGSLKKRTMTIRVFVTGGTFDKEYDELRGTLYFKDTHMPELLKLGRCQLDVAIRTLMMIDSLEMTDGDRATIVDHCRRCEEVRIVVTHGTDTIVETARTLAAGTSGKTIVLTGAMVPYAFGSSDGLFNLGSALSFVQVLPPGTYIAMNGRCFPWDDVRKNRETGAFEPLRKLNKDPS